MSVPRRRLEIGVASAVAAAYLAVALFVLLRGFPHEDAFILFKYANQLGCGHGVVFYPGGPHTEGGTDFLWLATLGLGRALGIDPAISAAVVNALGVFVLARLLASSVRGASGSRVDLGLVALVLVSSGCIAGYVGFSAPIYSASALVLYRAWTRGDVRALLAIPLLGLLLGWIRPDGVILAAGFTVLGAVDARRREDRRLARRFLIRVAIVVALGAIYFVARARYFGETLPLPLYVKSHYAGVPPGLGESIAWGLSTLVPLGLLALLGPRVRGGAEKDATEESRALLYRRLWGLAPFALHVVSFVPAVPSQNIADRFQAPTTVALLDLALFLGALRVPRAAWRAWAYAAAALLAIAPQIDMLKKEVGFALTPQYVNVLAADLGAIAPEARVAATEAGRIPFYTSGPALDLVGLDSRETARRPPTHDLIARFAPDLVMLHHAGALDENRLDDGSGRDVIRIDGTLADRMGAPYRRWLADPLPPYEELRAENVVVAPVAAAGYLDSARDRYDLYAVRFESRFFRFHVYALRRDWPAKEKVLAALESSHREAGAHAYLELQRARGDVCREP